MQLLLVAPRATIVAVISINATNSSNASCSTTTANPSVTSIYDEKSG